MMEWMTDFHFLRPGWLLLLIPALVLILSGRSRNSERKHWSRLIHKAMQPHMLLPVAGSARLSIQQWAGMVLVLGSMALAGPTWHRELPEGFEQEGVVYIVFDSRVSMDVDDIKPTRFQHSKQKLTTLAQQQPNLQFSIYAYADTAHQVTPASSDWVFHDLYLQGLSSSVMPVQRNEEASGLAIALDKINDAMQHSDIPGSVILITSHLTEQEATVVRQFASRHGIQVWATGTAEGASMKIAGRLIETRMSVESFRKLQRQGVPTVLMETGDEDLHEISSRLEHNLNRSQTDNPEFLWADYGRYLAVLLLPALLFWFRKGVRLLALMVIVVAGTPEAEASWDWFFTSDQQAQVAFNRGNYAKAASLYSDHYKKGVAYYQQGDWLQALQHLDLVDTDKAIHFKALSYAQLKYWDEAFEILAVLVQSHPEDKVINANYQAVAEVMAVLEKYRKQRLNDQELMDEGRDDADGFVQSELAEQGIDAKLEVSNGMVNPQNWLEGLEMTPEQLLRSRFQQEVIEATHE
ncbi:MAG: VWA domain-containing protein [Endozoicomonas sp.]